MSAELQKMAARRMDRELQAGNIGSGDFAIRAAPGQGNAAAMNARAMQLSGAPGGMAQQGLPVAMQSERGFARKNLDASLGNQTDLLADRATRRVGQSGVGHYQAGDLPGTVKYNPNVTPARAADVRRGALDAMGTARPNLPQEGRAPVRAAAPSPQVSPASQAPMANAPRPAPTQVMNQRPANATLPMRPQRAQAAVNAPAAAAPTAAATPGAKAAPPMPTSMGAVTAARPAPMPTLTGSTPRPTVTPPPRLSATAPMPKAPPAATVSQLGQQAKKVINPEAVRGAVNSAKGAINMDAAKGLWNSVKTNPMLRRVGMGAGLAGGALLAGKAISSLMPSKQQQPAVVVQR